MTFRILSLDGGGIRGVVSATLLQTVEAILKSQTPPQGLHDYFDLIAGTSTGSILAAGIVCELTADQLVRLYQRRGAEIFLNTVREERKSPLYYFSQVPLPEELAFLKQWLPSVSEQGYGLYPNNDPRQGLRRVLQEELRYQGQHPTIGEVTNADLLILAYDVYSRNTTWFVNDPNRWFKDLDLWQVCAASAAAPTFFPPLNLPYKHWSLPHIDGGVSANNPALSAIAHALWMNQSKNLKVSDISILSIGTGRTTKAYRHEEVQDWGLLNWATNIPNIFLDPPSKNSEDIGRQLLESINTTYLRLDFDLNLRSEQGQAMQPHNEYLYRQTGRKQKVNENIDDPQACNQLISATRAYLDVAEVKYQGETISVRTAIEQFIHRS
ncbi:MAG: patatin-like phospholipase family protein [Spirulinaceae cyanobacterium]